MEVSKECNGCRKILPLDDFATIGDSERRRYLCRLCEREYKRKWAAARRGIPPTKNIDKKRCPQCKLTLPVSSFHVNKGTASGIRTYCKKCEVERTKRWRYSKGIHRPLDENRACSAFLGVHIAERLLPSVFPGVIEKMPYGYPGYDFICGKGFKIDVKSACVVSDKTSNSRRWVFKIRRNKTADYFLLVAFDNRENLTPLRSWLFAAKKIRDHWTFSISNSQRGIAKWQPYEIQIDRILDACQKIKTT